METKYCIGEIHQHDSVYQVSAMTLTSIDRFAIAAEGTSSCCNSIFPTRVERQLSDSIGSSEGAGSRKLHPVAMPTVSVTFDQQEELLPHICKSL